MITKAFEIRDSGTFIPVIATKMVPSLIVDEGQRDFEPERYLLARAGYGRDPWVNPCVVLCRMECSGIDRNATYDPYSWGGGTRTYLVAHQYIIEHFDDLASGDVIDVEFIQGETTEPKKSEALEAYPYSES